MRMHLCCCCCCCEPRCVCVFFHFSTVLELIHMYYICTYNSRSNLCSLCAVSSEEMRCGTTIIPRANRKRASRRRHSAGRSRAQTISYYARRRRRRRHRHAPHREFLTQNLLAHSRSVLNVDFKHIMCITFTTPHTTTISNMRGVFFYSIYIHVKLLGTPPPRPAETTERCTHATLAHARLAARAARRSRRTSKTGLPCVVWRVSLTTRRDMCGCRMAGMLRTSRVCSSLLVCWSAAGPQESGCELRAPNEHTTSRKMLLGAL